MSICIKYTTYLKENQINFKLCVFYLEIFFTKKTVLEVFYNLLDLRALKMYCKIMTYRELNSRDLS